VALEAEVIYIVGVTFTELCGPTGDVMNPDTRACYDVCGISTRSNEEKVVFYSVADGGQYFATEKGNGDKPRPLTDTYDV